MSYSHETVRQALLSMDTYKVIAAQFGPRVAKKLHGVFRPQCRADAPLNKVYLDNTQIDCYVTINLRNGKTYKVRPWLTTVSDDHGSMVIGFALSFRAMTAGDILAALRHAILPKAYTEKWVGKSLKFTWEAMGIPDEIVVDNGLDLQAQAVYAACLSLGIHVTTTPPMEPWKKGRCERIFGTLNTKLFHRLPGTTFGRTDNKKKFEYDPKDFACLTLDELIELMHVTFEEMACSYHKGIKDIPIRRWREGVRRFPVRMPADLQEFDVQMSLRKPCTIRRNGIELHGLFYADEKLVALKGRMGRDTNVIVHIKPEDIRQVYVVDPASQTAIAVSCTTHFDGPRPLYLQLGKDGFERKMDDESAASDDADSDYRGTAQTDSVARSEAVTGIIDKARARREEIVIETTTPTNAQSVALDVRQGMEKPRPAPDSKAASAAVGRSLLKIPDAADKTQSSGRGRDAV